MRVFLSHSSSDGNSIRRVAADLRAHGVDVWLDEWEIKVGDSISQKIQAGLAVSDALAIWLTAASIRSRWVEREWMAKYYAEVAGGTTMVLPLLAEDCEIPVLLRDKRYADFRVDYWSGLDDLLEAVLPGYTRSDVLLRAVANIKMHTMYLWEDIRWLPINGRTTVCSEIRRSTYERILPDLETLANRGRLFGFRKEVAYQTETGEDVFELVLEKISPELPSLISRISAVDRNQMTQRDAAQDGESAIASSPPVS